MTASPAFDHIWFVDVCRLKSLQNSWDLQLWSAVLGSVSDTIERCRHLRGSWAYNASISISRLDASNKTIGDFNSHQSATHDVQNKTSKQTFMIHDSSNIFGVNIIILSNTVHMSICFDFMLHFAKPTLLYHISYFIWYDHAVNLLWYLPWSGTYWLDGNKFACKTCRPRVHSAARLAVSPQIGCQLALALGVLEYPSCQLPQGLSQQNKWETTGAMPAVCFL